MTWKSLLGIVAVVALMTVYEWPKINRKKEKWAFAVLSGIGAGFAILFMAYPNMPNPDTFVEFLYRPLTKLMGLK